MKKFFTFAIGLLLASSLSIKAEEVTVYISDEEGNEIANNFDADLTKDYDGVYTLANLFGVDEEYGIPFSFKFNQPEAGKSSPIEVTSNISAIDGWDGYYYIKNSNDKHPVFWIYDLNGIDDWVRLRYSYVYLGQNGSYVYRYDTTDPDNKYDYVVTMMISGDFYGKNPESDEYDIELFTGEGEEAPWLYLEFRFRDFTSGSQNSSDGEIVAAIDYSKLMEYPYGEQSFTTVIEDGALILTDGQDWPQCTIIADVPMEANTTYTITAAMKGSKKGAANLIFGNWGHEFYMAEAPLSFTDKWEMCSTVINVTDDPAEDGGMVRMQPNKYSEVMEIAWVVVSKGDCPPESTPLMPGDLSYKTATPTASFSNKMLTLSCQDTSAQIRYTTDGSKPTVTSTLYEAPVSLTADCTVKFFAIQEGYEDSEIVTFVFRRADHQVSKPSISYYPDSRHISLTCQTVGAEIRYTTDGSEPSATTGTVYNEPFAVASNSTYTAKAFRSDLFDSESAFVVINDLQVPTPTASFSNRRLTLTCPDTEATIRYTLDGIEPTAESTRYTGAFELTSDCTVRFIAFREGFNNSEEGTYEFAIADHQVALPEVTYDHTTNTVTMTCATEDASIRYTTNGNIPTATIGISYSAPFVSEGNYTYTVRAFRNDLFDSDVITLTVDDQQVPTPTASFSNKHLTLTCSDTHAKIHYTLDGTAPTATSTLYEAPITLTSDCTVLFIATRENFEDSEIGSFEFYIANYQVAKPFISYDESNRILTIRCDTEGAEIRYTTDETAPTATTGIKYVSPIYITSENILTVMAFKDGMFDSEISTYTIDKAQVQVPVATFENKMLTISCPDTQAQIIYSLEGSYQLAPWSIYDAPIPMTSDCTVKFYSRRDNYNDSEIGSYQFILVDHQEKMPSISKDYRNRKITISHSENCPVKVTIDGTTEEITTPNSIDIKPSMTSISVIAVATDPNRYDSEATREAIVFHKAPDIFYDGHNLIVSVADEGVVSDGAECVCYFNDIHVGSSPKNLSVEISDFGNISAYVLSDNAFCSITSEKTIDFFNTGTRAGARNGHRLSEVFGTWGDKKDDYTYLRVLGELNKEDLQLLASLPKLETLHFDHSLMTGERCDNIFADTRIKTVYFSNTFPQGLLMGMPRLTTVIWGKKDFKMPDGLLTEAGNPNILLWVPKNDNAPIDAVNIVIFNDTEDGKITDPQVSGVEGNAESITLQSGYPFHVHKPIHVKDIKVVKKFSLPTQKEVCQGWETLTLPFAATAITHETAGEITPFKSWDSNMSSTKPFWLYIPTNLGWEEAACIEARVPYIISMPNNSKYMDSFNLSGKVTFSANDVDLIPDFTSLVIAPWVNSLELVGSFMPVEDVGVLSLNVETSVDGELPGSAFVENAKTLPFGVYVRNVGSLKKIPLFGEENSIALPFVEGSEGFTIDSPTPGTISIFSIRALTIAIHTTTGALVRTVRLAAGETVHIEGLTKGIYLCAGTKVMVK